eukprot:223845-Chlamydomonas_euryale.AAC.1
MHLPPTPSPPKNSPLAHAHRGATWQAQLPALRPAAGMLPCASLAAATPACAPSRRSAETAAWLSLVG